jgi:flagellar biosynthesis protein FliR
MSINVAQAQFFFLALSRILAMIIQVPMLGGQNIPNQVRIGLGLGLTLLLVPWQPLPVDSQSLDLLGFSLAIAKEVLIGTLAGFAATLTFAAVQIAASVMGFGSGFDSGRIFNPSMNESEPAFNQLFIMVALLIFITINGHHLFLISIQKTFTAIPINGEIPLTSFERLARLFSQLVSSGIQLGLPVMVALTLTDLGLGLLARVAPQVQIYFLGLPMKVGIALYGLGLFFLVALPALQNLFNPIGSRGVMLLTK